jgi:hypothetical protein
MEGSFGVPKAFKTKAFKTFKTKTVKTTSLGAAG